MEVKPGFKQTEVGIIPVDWDVVSIGDLNPFITSGSRGWAAYYSEHGDPFVRITNLSRETIYIDIENLKYVSIPPEATEGKRTQLRNDDILISITADIGIIGYVTDDLPKPAYINQHIALVRFDSSKTDSKFVSYFLASEKPQKLFLATTDTGAKAGMGLLKVQKIQFALPPLSEQHAIAATLSDVDSLLDALDALLAKKRLIKQGAMQELLTSKKRLLGFIGEWKVKKLGDVCGKITTGKLDANAMVEDGEYRFYTCAKEYYQIDKYAFDTEALLVSGNGANVGYIHHYKGKFNAYQRTYVLSDFSDNVSYLKLFMDMYLQARIKTEVNAGNTPYIKMDTLTDMEIRLPSTIAEQTTIAEILSDMDAEIAALEARREKTRLLKQGMMQELLTGRIRLL